MHRQRAFRWLATLLASAACVGLAFFLVDLGKSYDILMESNRWLWLAVVVLSMLMGLLRALRVTQLVQPDRNLPVIKASLLHTAASALLPAKLGEAALPLALSRYAGLDMVHGIGLLLIVRLCDIAVLAGLGLSLFGFLNLWDLSTVSRVAIAALGGTLALSVCAVPLLARIGGTWRHRSSNRWALRISAAAQEVGRSSAISLAGSTFSIWLALVLAAQASVAAVGIDVDPALVALASVAASLAFALPVSGLANVGPIEAAFAGVLAAGGVPAEQALAAAVLLHLGSLAGAILPGLGALAVPVSSGEALRCT